MGFIIGRSPLSSQHKKNAHRETNTCPKKHFALANPLLFRIIKRQIVTDHLEVSRMVREPPRKRSPRKGLQVRILSLPDGFLLNRMITHDGTCCQSSPAKRDSRSPSTSHSSKTNLLHRPTHRPDGHHQLRAFSPRYLLPLWVPPLPI